MRIQRPANRTDRHCLFEKWVYTRFMSGDLPCLCSTLRRMTRAVTAQYDEALRRSGLRITQFAILRNLQRTGPVAVTRLAAEVAIDRSTMGRNLDPLERRGLVRLAVSGTDQRARIVHLTEAGAAAIAATLPAWQAAQSALATRLPASDLSALAAQLGAGQAST